MTQQPIKSYTVCFLFNQTLDKVLLILKIATEFRGQLNGIGGKIEPNETPFEGALREIEEESGVSVVRNLMWLGTLHLPHNCEKPDIPDNGLSDPACILYYFAGIVPDDQTVKTPDGGETVDWYETDAVLASRVTDATFAGNGDVQYFVGRGFDALSRHKTE